MRMPDIKMFYANPFDDNTARMQYRMLECRWEQYLNALAHILNTGLAIRLSCSDLFCFQAKVSFWSGLHILTLFLRTLCVPKTTLLRSVSLLNSNPR